MGHYAQTFNSVSPLEHSRRAVTANSEQVKSACFPEPIRTFRLSILRYYTMQTSRSVFGRHDTVPLQSTETAATRDK